ncbi:MAG: outer membrane protein transport protein [Gammaproteobacteria bacterium]|nr:outer membrane protein transport protein [Gammaproteobacteria bacterium]
MSRGIKKSLIALSVSGVLFAPSAFATNGYFSHGYSTSEKGLAGAGVAHSSDSLASATNPAGLVKVGSRMDVGAALFNPNRQYTIEGAPNPPPAFGLAPGTYESDHSLFLIPHIGYNSMIDDSSSWGIAAYGNGGMNSSYSGADVPPAGTFYGGTAGVNLSQLFINLSYSKQLNDKHSVGASAIFAYQMFKADGLGAFGAQGYSNDDTKLTNKGDDTSMGFGVKLGWQGEITQAITLGVSYQSEMAMSEFDDYAGLFAEQGDFDIPASATLGLAWKTSKSSTLVFDIQQIYYSDVASIGNGIENLFACAAAGSAPQPTCLGGSNGAGFGWDDMTVFKLGYEWGDDITWRVGVSTTDQPIQGGGETTPPPNGSQVLFNILAPGVVETHITAGMTMPLGSNSEISFAAMYAPSTSVKGSTQFDAQTAELEMDQFELQGTYTMKF